MVLVLSLMLRSKKPLSLVSVARSRLSVDSSDSSPEPQVMEKLPGVVRLLSRTANEDAVPSEAPVSA